MTPLRRIAATTAALIMIGGMPAVATAQAERTIAPEDIDAYVAEQTCKVAYSPLANLTARGNCMATADGMYTIVKRVQAFKHGD